MSNLPPRSAICIVKSSSPLTIRTRTGGYFLVSKPYRSTVARSEFYFLIKKVHLHLTKINLLLIIQKQYDKDVMECKQSSHDLCYDLELKNATQENSQTCLFFFLTIIR